MEDTLVSLIREVGPVLTAVAFFVWRDWKREGKLSGVIEAMQTWQRDTLTALLQETTKALAGNNEALKSFSLSLSARPCLVEDSTLRDSILGLQEGV